MTWVHELLIFVDHCQRYGCNPPKIILCDQWIFWIRVFIMCCWHCIWMHDPLVWMCRIYRSGSHDSESLRLWNSAPLSDVSFKYFSSYIKRFGHVWAVFFKYLKSILKFVLYRVFISSIKIFLMIVGVLWWCKICLFVMCVCVCVYIWH